MSARPYHLHVPAPPSVEILTLPGPGAPLQLTLVRSDRRTRSIALQVLPPGRITVRAPRTLPLTQVRAFVASRESWLRARLEALALAPSAPSAFGPGRMLSYLGRELSLTVNESPHARSSVALQKDGIVVSLPAPLISGSRDAAIRAALEHWYRARAGDLLPPIVERWSASVGRSPAAVLIRAQRSRWGSCSSAGVIRLNCRLAMLPPELIDYVVLHELVHLRHANHGPEFWAEVERHMPAARLRRRALARLSAYCTL